MEERLQKIMAHAGIGSRRSCETIIAEGRVTINGVVAKVGDKADPKDDEIVVDGERITRPEKRVYIMVHKPRGVISDEDDLGRRTVRHMVDYEGHLYPVGRLDKQSLGLILLTNDGHVAHLMTHPRYEHEKVYRVKVEGSISRDTLQQWRKGVMLEDGMTAPAKVKALDQKMEYTWLQVTMHEGRKRQIRRVASQLGHPVMHLERTQLGPLHIGDLELGKWRYLTPGEVGHLRKYVARGKERFERKKQRQKKNDQRPTRGRKGPRRR